MACDLIDLAFVSSLVALSSSLQAKSRLFLHSTVHRIHPKVMQVSLGTNRSFGEQSALTRYTPFPRLIRVSHGY